jgi:uncharacterized protein with PhoU and TrkA domain
MRTTSAVVEEEVLKYYQITAGELFNSGRSGLFKENRYIFYFLAEKYTANSMLQIGRHAGQLRGKQYDHATVLHGRNKIRDYIAYDKKLLREIEEIIGNIKANPNTVYTENTLVFKNELDSLVAKDNELDERLAQIVASHNELLERVKFLEGMYINALEVV